MASSQEEVTHHQVTFHPLPPGGLWPEIKVAPCFWEEEDKPVGKVARPLPGGLCVWTGEPLGPVMKWEQPSWGRPDGPWSLPSGVRDPA